MSTEEGAVCALGCLCADLTVFCIFSLAPQAHPPTRVQGSTVQRSKSLHVQRLSGGHRCELSRLASVAMKNLQKRARRGGALDDVLSFCRSGCRERGAGGGAGSGGARFGSEARDPRVACCVAVSCVAVLCSLHLNLGVDTRTTTPNLSAPPRPSTNLNPEPNSKPTSAPYHSSNSPSFFLPSSTDSLLPTSCPHHTGHDQHHQPSAPGNLPLLLSYLYPALTSPPPPLLFHFVLYSTGRLLLRGGDGDVNDHAVPATAGTEGEQQAQEYLRQAREAQEV